MSRKNKKKIQETTIEDFYDLRIDKIDELVAALKGEDNPEEEVNYDMNTNMGVDDPANVTRRGKQKKFDPYKLDKFSRIPAWLKAVFIKWWFAGGVCYFMIWGLSLADTLDRIVLVGAVLGIVVDLLVNPLFHYMQSDAREYDDYMMFPFPFKQFWTFFTNIIYYVFVMFCVNLLYVGLNALIDTFSPGWSNVFVEPMLFAVFCVIADMALIGIKDGVVHLVRRLQRKKKESMANA